MMGAPVVGHAVRRLRCLAATTAWAVLAASGPPAAAADTPSRILALVCAGQLASGDPIPAVGRDIGFTTTMPFEDGHFIALSSPDTNSIQRLLYGSEVLTGTIGIGRAPAEEMAFTRATSRTGSLVGFTIDGGGDIVSLAIRAAPKGTGERPFDLLATGSGAVYRGSCH